MVPEIHQRLPYNGMKTDVFALGVALRHMVAGTILPTMAPMRVCAGNWLILVIDCLIAFHNNSTGPQKMAA